MSTQSDYKPGIDISSLNSITQAQLLQAFTGLVPVGDGAGTSGGVGGVIVLNGGGGTHWPDVTNNPRYSRYVWIDTYVSTAPVIKVWKGTYDSDGLPAIDDYASWVSNPVPSNSITTAMIQAAAVTIAKLGGRGNGITDAGKVLVLDGTGEAVTVYPVNTLLSAATTQLPIARFYPAPTVASQIMKASAGLVPEWATYDPATDINNGTSTVQQAKLDKGALTQFQAMSRNAANTAWVGTYLPTFASVAGVALANGASGVANSNPVTHNIVNRSTGAATVPLMWKIVLVVTGATTGFSIGDEVPANSLYAVASGAMIGPVTPWINKTQFGVTVLNNISSPVFRLMRPDTGAVVDVTLGNLTSRLDYIL